MTVILIGLGLSLLVLIIFLEAKRQERMLGEKASGKGSPLGTGLLEVESLLQPDRKVTTMQEALQNPDRVEVEHDQSGEEEPPEATRS